MSLPDTGGIFRLLLTADCSRCGARKGSPCINVATGRRKPVMHEARHLAVLAPVPAPANGELARQQVSAARAERGADLDAWMAKQSTRTG